MTDDLGDIRSIRIEDEMRVSYLDYAMSVIVSRALPDVRDGFKPGHRRILYAMGEMGLSATSSYRKCASIFWPSTAVPLRLERSVICHCPPTRSMRA